MYSLLRVLFVVVALDYTTQEGRGQLATEQEVRRHPRWSIFEESVHYSRALADPYRDISLEVVYTTPAGEEIHFWGFYDGGDVWRFRFMPEINGVWKYKAVFSDGTLAKEGEFRVVSSDLPGMLNVHRGNRIWFSGDVRPVLIRGLHVGDRFFAENWDDKDRKTFLDWAQKQGYNLLSVASHYLNRDTVGRGRGWETPRLWPLDAKEYRKLERHLDELAGRRMYSYPFAGFFGQASNYPREAADQEVYARYALARIGAYWNILLNVAGPEPSIRGGWMLPNEVNRLGRLIRDFDVFGHPLSVHNATGDDPYRDEEWVSYGTLQGPKTLDRKLLGETLRRNLHPEKPLLAQETLWPGNKFHPVKSADDIRKNAYVIMFSAGALIFGDFAGDSSSGFSGTLDFAAIQQFRHDAVKVAWDFFESVRYYNMRPRQDLVSNGYCLAQAGREYLVYLDAGGMVDVKIEGGPYLVTWVNARDPSDRRSGGITVDGRRLTAPTEADDWVVVLAKTGGGLAEQIRISWQNDPATTLTLTWHTESPHNPVRADYRIVGDNTWKSINGQNFRSPGDGWLHRAEITGLTPGTAYEYRVSHDNNMVPAMGDALTTRTAPRTGPFSVAVIGDTGLVGRIDGNSTGTRRIMDSIERDRPNFILGLGDYAYFNRDRRFQKVGDAADEWFNQWQHLIARFPLMAQYGNHEIKLDERFEDWAPRFAHPSGQGDGRNFAFRVGDVHFVGLFVPDDRIEIDQLRWLEDTLSAARADVRWLVVFHHEPIFAHGRSHPAKSNIQARFAPLYERHRVDLLLTSHDQNYERTHQISGAPKSIRFVQPENGYYAKGNGVLYVKISPSGKKSEIGNSFSRFVTDQQDFIAKRETGAYHYSLLKSDGKGSLSLETYTIPEVLKARRLLDRFHLISQ